MSGRVKKCPYIVHVRETIKQMEAPDEGTTTNNAVAIPANCMMGDCMAYNERTGRCEYMFVRPGVQ